MRTRSMRLVACVAGWLAIGATSRAAPSEIAKEAIFPAERKHNHASCVVETSGGDLLAVWYSGSGEREADDVQIHAAWRPKGAEAWSPRFVTLDAPGYPDVNPALFAQPDGRVRIVWPTVLDHRWEGALLKYAVTGPDPKPGPIEWRETGVFHLSPEPKQFADAVRKSEEALPADEKAKLDKSLGVREHRADDLLYQRLGWMPRVHGVALKSGRWIQPLYCDTFSASIMAISDDRGRTWRASDLLVGFGAIQPSVVQKGDGTLVAFLRDNGPRHRIRVSTSGDEGLTWTPVVETGLQNPGAGIEAIRLASGRWAMVYNDLDKGRHSLAVVLSDDEGKTWNAPRHVERAEPGAAFHYPSLMQARDGMIHLTYTHSVKKGESTIMHAAFPEEWARAGD